VYTFLNRKWLFDKVYNEWLVQGLLKMGYTVSYKALDRGAAEMVGPQGIRELVSSFSLLLSGLQSGYLYHYAFVMVLGLLAFLSIPSWASLLDLDLLLLFSLLAVLGSETDLSEKK
jgi:NADH:ubiquinone oxidoreductase subunit 5 (subunit L)/multisubunit Na+/H+ antiporter MnhA subunit